MIADLKPYPERKESGVDWLGAIPKAWNVRRLGSITTPVSRRRRTDLPLLSVLREKGVVYREEGDGNHNVVPEDLTNYKVVESGDLVINKMKAWQGSLGVAAMDGLVSPAYFVYRLRVVEPHYAHALLRSRLYVRAFAAASSGVRVGQWDLSPIGMKSVPILIPSRREQVAIVRFLGYVDSRIQRLIAAKERAIELLVEEKQAVIYNAVTCGLDPDTPLKPSGVDWLGEIPEHWNTVTLRRITTSRCDGPFGSGLTSAHYVDHGVRVVRLQNIALDGFQNGDRAFISQAHYSTLGDHDVVAGDVLIAGLGDDKRYVGRACVAPSEIEPAMVKADCFRFRLKPPQYPPFVACQLSATSRLIAGQARGSTRQRINLGDMSARPVVLPPIQEQHAIGDFLKRVDSKAQVAIKAAEREIGFLREYRISLISDVVTGKLDVRKAAERLPDDPNAADLALDDHLEKVIA